METLKIVVVLLNGLGPKTLVDKIASQVFGDLVMVDFDYEYVVGGFIMLQIEATPRWYTISGERKAWVERSARRFFEAKFTGRIYLLTGDDQIEIFA